MHGAILPLSPQNCAGILQEEFLEFANRRLWLPYILKVPAMDCRKVRRSGKRSSLMSTALLSDRFASRPKRTIHDPFGEQVKAAKRILVVDDCSDGRRMIADILNCIGFDVTVANGGQAGCDLALSAAKSRQAFDLILMDVQMPGFDGYEATAQLRSSGYSGRIVALKSESCLFDATHTRSQEAGCDGYASKPITFAML